VILADDLCERRGQSNDSGSWEMAKNRAGFANKLAVSWLIKNYNF